MAARFAEGNSLVLAWGGEDTCVVVTAFEDCRNKWIVEHGCNPALSSWGRWHYEVTWTDKEGDGTLVPEESLTADNELATQLANKLLIMNNP